MEQSSYMEMTVQGKGMLTFWWKISCEPDPRGRHSYDNLSYAVDGTDVAWIDGETGWAQQIVTFDTDGAHTVRWTYATDDWEEPGYSNRGWVDGVVWTPVGGVPAVDPLPEIASDSGVADALTGAADEARLKAHIVGKAQYDRFRAWADAKGLDHQAVKDSPRAWFSYAIGAGGLVEKTFTKDDVTLKSLKVAADGSFSFEVDVTDVALGASATAEGLATVFGIQGAATLADDAFSSKNVTVTLGVSANGRLSVTATPKQAGGTFFVRVRMYADEDGVESDPGERPVVVSFAITFDANGGTGGTTRSVAHGSQLGTMPTPVRDGHDFAGWFTAASGGVQISASTVPTGDATYYAHWTAKQVATHEKVQLWENGPYWATTNIGAENPEDYGYYFWWGDTVGYKRENDKWVASDGSSSNFSFSSGNAPTYNKSIATLQGEGWIAADSVLVPERDAAHVHWGGDWRMPTEAEFSDLIKNCTTAWIVTNGVSGRLVTGKGDYSDRSIFLPAAGFGGDSDIRYADEYGGYWSSEPNSDDLRYGRRLDFGSYSFHFYRNNFERYYGQSVRPVQGFTK